MVFKVRGILDFSPEDKTKKHASQASWKRVAMIRTNCDLDRYYAWFLKKRFSLELNSTLRGTHVTFINDKMDAKTFEQFAQIFNGKEIDFYVETEPRSNGEHWWLRVHCPEAESIREVMGLSREPFYGMHLTLGYTLVKYPEATTLNDSPLAIKVRKDYIEHSKYILECCKRHELISNEPRKPLSEHEIIEFKYNIESDNFENSFANEYFETQASFDNRQSFLMGVSNAIFENSRFLDEKEEEALNIAFFNSLIKKPTLKGRK